MAFLGEATPDTAKKVATALAKVPQTAVCWRFSGLGVFSRQQILWAGLAETDRFNALAEQVRLCLDSTMTGNPFAHISRSLANGRGRSLKRYRAP